MSILKSHLSTIGNWGRKSGEALGLLNLRKNELLEQFPGPALIMSPGFAVSEYNHHAEPLLDELRKKENSSIREAFEKGVKAVSANLQTATIEEPGADPKVFDITFLPLENPKGGILVTAKNVTIQRNLTNALIASRQLFKDLVTCTAEFVWETDEKGQFRYVSPRGAFGYSAAELDGRSVSDMMMQGSEQSEVGQSNPFVSKTPVGDHIVWIRSKNNDLVCMTVTSIPVFDQDGNWTGCRGAGKDITEDMQRSDQLDRLAAQEEMLSNIVDAIRKEVDPEKLFQIAGDGTCEILNSTRLWIGRRNLSGSLETVYANNVSEDQEAYLFDWFSKSSDTANEIEEFSCISDGNSRYFLSPLYTKGQLDGVVAVVRRQEAMDLDEDDRRLIHHLSEHLGVALIQIKAREKLVELSRTDELSGLLNRRAFNEDVVKRVEHGKRTKLPNALFYIDLDNFKPVNDRFGHEKGDEVLVGISRLLQNNSRVGDLVSRLGGDEFSMWLENITPEEAILKAEDLQKKCLEVSEKLEVRDPSLSFSIGIVCASGHPDDTLESLLSSADAAMYDVKAKGKGSHSLVYADTAGE